jgi:ligand-binding sensor domain-containing protein
MNIVNELDGYHLAYWADQMPAEAITMRAPAEMTDCSDCAAIVTEPKDGEVVVRVAWKPNEIELAHLARGGTIWLSTWGGLPPHMLEVQEPAP